MFYTGVSAVYSVHTALSLTTILLTAEGIPPLSVLLGCWKDDSDTWMQQAARFCPFDKACIRTKMWRQSWQ